MNSALSKLAVAGACALSIAGLAACGSSSDDTSSTTAASSSTAATQGTNSAAQVNIDDNDSLGQILVDADGNTLYLFEADTSSKSTCDGDCAKAWPPLLTRGDPTAGSGADASLLGTSKRSDGTTQASYAGHPLYLYAGDTAPGQTNGNDVEQFGAEWYALTPTGEEPEDKGGDEGAGDDESSDDSTSDSGGGYGSY